MSYDHDLQCKRSYYIAATSGAEIASGMATIGCVGDVDVDVITATAIGPIGCSLFKLFKN